MSLIRQLETRPAVSSPPQVHTPGSVELASMLQAAEILARSDMLPPQFKNRPANVLWAMIKADQLGWDVVTAIEQISVINNRPTISAFGMRALCVQAGHKFRVLESTDDHCTVEVVRLDDPEHPHQETFTMAMAERSGDAGKAQYRKYPARMLLARATSNAVSASCPEVLMGAAQYTPDEMGGVEPSAWIQEGVDELPEVQRPLAVDAKVQQADVIVEGGDSGVPVDTVTVQDDPPSTLDVDPGEADNGGELGATGPTDPGSAMAAMRGTLRATIDQLDKPQRARLRGYLARRDWKTLDDVPTAADLVKVGAYVNAMIPPDDPEPTEPPPSDG